MYVTINYNMYTICIRNTARSKLIPLLCTHVYSYMFSIVHPPRSRVVHFTVLAPGYRVAQDPSDSKSSRLHVDKHLSVLMLSFIWGYVYTSIDSSKMIGGNSPEVLMNFNRLYLKLNRFICNQPPVLPEQWSGSCSYIIYIPTRFTIGSCLFTCGHQSVEGAVYTKHDWFYTQKLAAWWKIIWQHSRLNHHVKGEIE